MDWLTFIVRVIDALAWPSVVLFICWFGRSRIGALFDRVEHFEGWGAKALFAKRLDKLPETQSKIGAPASVPPLNLKLAELAPTYVIQQAWFEVEKALNNLMEKNNISANIDPDVGTRVPFKINPVRFIEKLGFSEQTQAIIKELKSLRDDAIHKKTQDIAITDALRYNDKAKEILSVIEQRIS